MIKQKIDYLLRSVLNFRQTKKCSFCNSSNLTKVDSKFLFTSLLQCENCKLMHRHPKDDEKWLNQFYQSEYKVETHLMTQLPSDSEIEKLKSNSFSSLRSYDNYLNALFKNKSDLKIIDYGCSWGYNVYKLIKSGYDAVGYELSVPRAEFGKNKLGVPIFSDIDKLPRAVDVMFSSHVIEHLSNINDFILLSKKFLTNDGVFIAFCPNGGQAYRKRESHEWHVNWGAVHPNYLSIEFASYAFKNNPYLILTGDWTFDLTAMFNWDGISQVNGPYQEGKELLIISKPNLTI